MDSHQGQRDQVTITVAPARALHRSGVELTVTSTRPVHVSVIVPTTCERGRANLIERAIDSVARQDNVDLDLIVVVNGPRADRSLLDRLTGDSRLRILMLEEGNVSLARHEGLAQANGDFFCFLDDDDELLPGSIAMRVDLLRRHPEADFVVTNGFIHASVDVPLVDKSVAARINEDPAGSALVSNYFANPAALFRKARIDHGIFAIRHRYFEWTYLLFALLSCRKTLWYEDCLTYRKYEDNPASVSKTDEYALAYPAFLAELSKLPLDRRTQSALHQKYLSALHAVSNMYLKRRRLGDAWKHHLRCVAGGGWRYIAHSRHLIRESVARLGRQHSNS